MLNSYIDHALANYFRGPAPHVSIPTAAAASQQQGEDGASTSASFAWSNAAKVRGCTGHLAKSKACCMVFFHHFNSRASGVPQQSMTLFCFAKHFPADAQANHFLVVLSVEV